MVGGELSTSLVHHRGYGNSGMRISEILGLQKPQYESDFVDSDAGQTLRFSLACSGISDCPRGCATRRMAPTTSRSTSHHRNQDILRRIHQALPLPPGKTACASELPSPRTAYAVLPL